MDSLGLLEVPPHLPQIPSIHPPRNQPLCRFILDRLKPQQVCAIGCIFCAYLSGTCLLVHAPPFHFERA